MYSCISQTTVFSFLEHVLNHCRYVGVCIVAPKEGSSPLWGSSLWIQYGQIKTIESWGLKGAYALFILMAVGGALDSHPSQLCTSSKPKCILEAGYSLCPPALPPWWSHLLLFLPCTGAPLVALAAPPLASAWDCVASLLCYSLPPKLVPSLLPSLSPHLPGH